jgi:hypothetical protein
MATPHLNWVASFYALAFGGLLLAADRAGDLFGRLHRGRQACRDDLYEPADHTWPDRVLS